MDRSEHPHPTFEAAAVALVAAGRRLGRRRLIAGCDGNLSARLGRSALAVTPAGRRKDELQPDDILAVPLEPDGGTPEPGARRPSSDIAVHRAVYGARPDARAVAHAHPPAVLACLLAGLLPDPRALPEAGAVIGRLGYVPALPFGSDAVAAATAGALQDPAVGAVLLDRHGALAVGRTVEEAVDRLEVVELLCATWLAAWQAAGDPRRASWRQPGRAGASRAPGRVRRRP